MHLEDWGAVTSTKESQSSKADVRVKWETLGFVAFLLRNHQCSDRRPVNHRQLAPRTLSISGETSNCCCFMTAPVHRVAAALCNSIIAISQSSAVTQDSQAFYSEPHFYWRLIARSELLIMNLVSYSEQPSLFRGQAWTLWSRVLFHKSCRFILFLWKFLLWHWHGLCS